MVVDMEKPQVKRVMYPVVLPGNRIQMGLNQYGTAAHLQDDDGGSIERLLLLLDGSRSIDEICEAFEQAHPEWDTESVKEVIGQLAEAGFLEDAAGSAPGLTDREIQRYAPTRHFYAWIDTTPRSSPYEIQERLKNSRVTVFGIGGTGSAVATGLVASGVGRVHVVDFDRVEESNLTRQLLFTERDIGRLKIDVAVERLRAINSLIEITGEDRQVNTPDEICALMADCDIFVLGADTPRLKVHWWANEAALRTATPWYMVYYDGPTVTIASLKPGSTGCWACLRRDQDLAEFVSAGRPLMDWPPTSVVCASANITGQLCALDVVYQLSGISSQVLGKVYRQNLARWDDQYFVPMPRYDDCPACGDGGDPARMSDLAAVGGSLTWSKGAD